jgi:glutathione synthase/RimK-type ligase-like ATP-grasp enzyme
MAIENKIRVVILQNENPEDHLLWINACNSFVEKIEWRVVDLIKNDWLERVQKKPFDILLVKPGNLSNSYKQLYDERIFILSHVLKYTIFPSLEEIFIYENKRFLSFWLNANKIPHPKTAIFYTKNEALDYLKSQKMPIVGKTNIGASGSGVEILKNINEAQQYIENTFSGKGALQRTGPNFSKGGIIGRGLHYLFNPSKIRKKLFIYKTRASGIQKEFVILQQFVKHEYEWRVVRIGDSFFAHKKLLKGDKASGSLLKGYENPPLTLLNFVKEITDKHKFYSQAVDVFESEDGYLVNEMQCIFGQSDPYQMLIDGKPGRYVYQDNKWLFESGDFNRNESYNLRLEHIIEKFKQENNQ